MNGAQPVSGEWSNSFDIPVRDAPGAVQPTARSTPKPLTKLSIVLPFIEREVPQVLKLLDWMRQLSGQLDRTLYLLPFKGLDIDEIKKLAKKAFADVQIIQDSEGVLSDWRADEKIRDAAGPNSLFRQAAWFFYVKPNLGPWLWLEPDCVPLTSTWDDQFEDAYRSAIASGKPFLGVKMKWKHTKDEYLNGAAIYPQNAIQIAPQLVTRTMWIEYPEMEIGFDVAGGKAVERQAQVTDLIQLDYRSEQPTPQKGAVLFHGDRSGKLLDNFSGGSNADKKEARRPGLAHQPRSPAQKRSKTAGYTSGQRRNPHKVSPKGFAGSNPAPATNLSARLPKSDQGRSQPNRKNKAAPGAHNGSKVQPSVVPTIGDEIRYHVSALQSLASNQNRKTRILAALRKTTLLPRIAR